MLLNIIFGYYGEDKAMTKTETLGRPNNEIKLKPLPFQISL